MIKKISSKFSLLFKSMGDGNTLGFSRDVQVHSSACEKRSTLQGNINIGEGAFVDGCVLCGDIDVGRYTSINGPNTDIYTFNPVSIGSFCSIARGCNLQAYSHIYDRITSYFILHHIFGEDFKREVLSGRIVIENDVWIGAQCVILQGAHISSGVVVGANSLVNSFLPPYSVCVGSPARPVRFRFDDSIIQQLLSIKWWDWDIDKIKINRNLFACKLTQSMIDGIK